LLHSLNKLLDAAEILRPEFDPEARDTSFQTFRALGHQSGHRFAPDQRSKATRDFRERYDIPSQREGEADIDHIISAKVGQGIFGAGWNPNFDENFWPLASDVNRFDKGAGEAVWSNAIKVLKRQMQIPHSHPLPLGAIGDFPGAEAYYNSIRDDVFEKYLGRGGVGTLPREVPFGKLTPALLDELERALDRLVRP